MEHPGAAHAATFWGFIILLLTITEAYGALFRVRTTRTGKGAGRGSSAPTPAPRGWSWE